MDELTEYKHAHDYWEAEAKHLRAELAVAKQRIAELEAALEHNNSALDGVNAIIAKLERGDERWKRCPSTHCERRGECASPHECIVKVVAFRPTISGRED